MTDIDGQEPRNWFEEAAAAYKAGERYAPGRYWMRPVKPPSRWARWRSRLLWWRR